MKKLLLSLLAIFFLFGCAARNKDGLTYFNFTRTNSMVADGASSWTVEALTETTVLVTIKEEGLMEHSYKTSYYLMNRLCEIVNSNKMYRYKGYYRTKLEVLDGTSWDFSLKFADGTSTSASGYMKYPKGGGPAFREAVELIEQMSPAPNNSKMTRFSYGKYNGMAPWVGKSYVVYSDKEGMVHIDLNVEKNDELRLVTNYDRIFEDLQSIVLKKGMFTFRGDYMPRTEIRDGSSWSLDVDYQEGPGISAGGYMAWPEGFGEAIDALESYFGQWRQMPAKDGMVKAEDAENALSGLQGQAENE